DTRHLTIQDGSRHEAKIREALAAVVELLQDSPAALSGRAGKDGLADSECSRDAIDAALQLGVKRHVLTKRDGPKRSKLYSVSVRVSGSVRSAYPDTSE